jgi:hypothetical protein
MDNPKIRGPQERSRAHTEQVYEVRYGAEECGVTEDPPREAVQRVGSSGGRLRAHWPEGRSA